MKHFSRKTSQGTSEPFSIKNIFIGRTSMRTAEAHGFSSQDGYDTSPLPRLTWASVFMGVLVSMGGFIFGYDTGQISGFLGMQDFLQRFGQVNQNGGFYFSNVRAGLIVAMLSIGTLIGALVAAPIADRIGRKYSISAWCIIFHVGMIVQIASPVHKWYQVMMGRWVAGLAIGALSLLVPMYQAETAPPHIRGALISTYQLFITLGIFVAACINFGTEKRHNTGSWRIPMGIGFLWALILGIGILFFPETPRFDYRHGRVERAKATMTKIYGVSSNHWSIHHELEEIHAQLASETQVQGGFFSEVHTMFMGPRMTYRIALGMVLQMFQQLTGANYFFYYGTTIFRATGINNSFVTQMILNGINFGSTFYGLYIVEHYGRRRSLIAGSAWMFVCFIIFASVGHFALDRANPQNTPHAGVAMICFAAFFIFGFATTWGPMIWTIAGELYPSRHRAKAMALSTASNWLWNFLLAFFTPFIVGDIDFRYGYVFAACNIVAGCIVYFFVIEGQGRTLEEIDAMYVLHVKPWRSKSWVVLPADEMHRVRRESTEDGVAVPEKAVRRERGDGTEGTDAEGETFHQEAL